MPQSQSLHRVALVSSSYHPHFGGVEEHVRQVAAELQERGHAVEVWTVDRGERLRQQVVDGVTVRYLPTPLPARRVSNLARFAVTGPVAFTRWLLAAREFRPDVLHVHCFGPNGPYARAVASVARVPLVLTSHGETFMDENDIFARSALLRKSLTRANASANRVTAVSSLVVDDLRQRFGASQVDIVPNGVTVIPTSRQATARGEDIVAVGRFVQVKGFDLLLRAVALTSVSPRLRLVGDGPERANLERLVTDLGLDDRVEFLGRRGAAEVREVMSSAGVVVMPSRREAFGIVALEAWASGAPLIATSTGGPAGFVTHGVDGLLVDPEDTGALAKAIDKVLASPSFAASLAEQGGESVKRFTWGRVVDDYEEIYRSVAPA